MVSYVVVPSRNEDFLGNTALREKLRKLARKYVRPPDDEDIVQDVLANAVHRDDLHRHPNPKALLCRQVIHRAIDAFRKSARRPTSDQDVDSLVQPESILLMVDLVALRSALARLPSDESAVVNLRIEGHTFQEIGHRIGCSTGEAFRRLDRAVQALERILRESSN